MTDSKQLTRIESLFQPKRNFRPRRRNSFTRPAKVRRTYGTIFWKHSKTITPELAHGMRRRFLEWLPSHPDPGEEIKPAMVGRYIAKHVGSILAHANFTWQALESSSICWWNATSWGSILPLPGGGLRYEAVEGKRRRKSPSNTQKLLATIRVGRENKKDEFVPLIVVIAGDRAIIATLIYTAARAGRCRTAQDQGLPLSDGSQWTFRRLPRKRGKSREIPVRHDLQEYTILAYVATIPDWQADNRCGLCSERRSAERAAFTANEMTNIDICRMVKRQLPRGRRPAEALVAALVPGDDDHRLAHPRCAAGGRAVSSGPRRSTHDKTL